MGQQFPVPADDDGEHRPSGAAQSLAGACGDCKLRHAVLKRNYGLDVTTTDTQL